MKGGVHDDGGPRFDLLEIVGRLHGEEARNMVADVLGGIMVYVPRKPRPDHPLVTVLGRERAQAVADDAHGVWSYVSGLRASRERLRRAAVLADALAGVPARTTANTSAPDWSPPENFPPSSGATRGMNHD